MATSDKHCQTPCVSRKQASPRLCVMFDESVAVEGREVDSSPGSEDEALRAAMSKFQPPARHTARHDFGSDSDSDSSPEKFTANASEEEQSPHRRPKSPEKEPAPASRGSGARARQSQRPDTSTSESDSGEEPGKREVVVGGGGGGRRRGAVLPADGAYDPEQFRDLKVPPDIENLFQYIMKYSPQKMEVEARLRPFVPECAPAVGDCDALLKLSTPPALPAQPAEAPLSERLLKHVDDLGLTILDEPAAEQSDPALLHLQLRAISKTAGGKTTLTRKIEEAEKNPKAIERWVRDVAELHAAAPRHAHRHHGEAPDVDSLMEEWPARVEEALEAAGFPPPALRCSLPDYCALVCALLDVPLRGPELPHQVQALHALFALYSAVKSSQLYAERRADHHAA
ncbi:unnamed protein product, partial [Iphiclides podalirius]